MSPAWRHKETGQKVSFYGSLPVPLDDYEQVEEPTIEVNRNGRITYSNYFFGRVLKTLDDCHEVIARLNHKPA